MNEIDKLAGRVEMLEARCQYLGVVCSAMLHALPDGEKFLLHLAEEARMNDANSLYATSLSDRQQATLQAALNALVDTLRAKQNSQDQP